MKNAEEVALRKLFIRMPTKWLMALVILLPRMRPLPIASKVGLFKPKNAVRFLPFLLMGAAPPPPPVNVAQQFAALRTMDARLAAIGYRLARANVALCDRRQPGTGIVFQAIDQYSPSVRSVAGDVFGFPTPVAVELVVPGSPAADAGVAAGDGLVAIDGTPVPAGLHDATLHDRASGATRDAVLAMVAEEDPTQPLTLSLLRAGRTRMVTLPPAPVCRAAFEVLLGSGPIAQSDGRIVQVGVSYLEKLDDDMLAVVVAHELAHIALHHRVRLEAAGVHWGLRAELGGSAALFRRTEDEADALGAVLMRNAGYDPHLAVTFWRQRRAVIDWGGGAHASAGRRADAIAAVIAAIPPDAPMPWVPPMLAARDRPLR